MTSLSVEKEKSDCSMENRGTRGKSSMHLRVSVQVVFKSLRLDETKSPLDSKEIKA